MEKIIMDGVEKFFADKNLQDFCCSSYKMGINPMPILRKKFPFFKWDYSVDGSIKDPSAITVSGVFGGFMVHFPTEKAENFIVNPVDGEIIPANSFIIQTYWWGVGIFQVCVSEEVTTWYNN